MKSLSSYSFMSFSFIDDCFVKLLSKIIKLLFIIFIMFLFRKQEYPKAQEIHKEADQKTLYEFLSFAPREELNKLNLSQVDFLFKKGLFMPSLGSSARPSDLALYLLVMRKKQIQREEEMRKNGIEPPLPKKEEPSLFSKFTSKVAGFFKFSRENSYSPLDDNISTPLRRLTQ